MSVCDIQKLNNAELIELFQKNGLGQFVDVIRQSNIDGKILLEKTEFEIKILGGSEYKTLWRVIQNMINNPGDYFENKKKFERRPSNRMLSTRITVQNKQELENIFRVSARQTSTTSVEQNNDIDNNNEEEASYLVPIQIKTPTPDNSPDFQNPTYRESSDGGYEPVPTFPKMKDRPLPEIPKVPTIIETPKIIEKEIKIPMPPMDDLYYEKLTMNPNRNLTTSRPLPNPPVQQYMNNSLGEDQWRKAKAKTKTILSVTKRGPLPLPPTPVEDGLDIYENSEPSIQPRVGALPALPTSLLKTDDEIYENPDDYDPRQNTTNFPGARRPPYHVRAEPVENSPRIQFTPPTGAYPTPFSRNIDPVDDIYENNEIDSRLPSRSPKRQLSTASNNHHQQDDSPDEIYENTTDSRSELDNNSGEIYENNEIIPPLKPAQRRRENYTLHVPGLPRPPILRPVNQQMYSLPNNLNDFIYFRNTDRVGAKRLLRGLEDGAFLFRKSSQYYVVLVIKYGDKFFNLGIIREGNKIKCDTNQYMSPTFNSFEEFIAYFTTSPLTIKHDHEYTVFLRSVLPADRY